MRAKKCEFLEQNIQKNFSDYQTLQKEIKDTDDKLKRAQKNEQNKLKALQQTRAVNEDNIHLVQARYDIEYNKTKILQSILNHIGQDYPEIGNIIED